MDGVVGVDGVDGVVGLVGLVWRKKLTVTPKKENKNNYNNNFSTTRPAKLVTNSIPICFSLAEKSLCMIKLVTRALPVRYGRYLVFNNHSSPDFGVRPQSPSG